MYHTKTRPLSPSCNPSLHPDPHSDRLWLSLLHKAGFLESSKLHRWIVIDQSHFSSHRDPMFLSAHTWGTWLNPAGCLSPVCLRVALSLWVLNEWVTGQVRTDSKNQQPLSHFTKQTYFLEYLLTISACAKVAEKVEAEMKRSWLVLNVGSNPLVLLSFTLYSFMFAFVLYTCPLVNSPFLTVPKTVLLNCPYNPLSLSLSLSHLV